MESDGIKAERLKHAREWLGFSVAEVARALDVPLSRVEDLEAGISASITGLELRQLSRLYRRPIAWFRGETRFEPGQDLLRQVENLSDGDREVVLEFAEWLQGAGPALKPRREKK